MNKPLTIRIYSFSYKLGLPQNASPHGGGFVFDCRCLSNPGREAQYKKLSGKDVEVITFLKNINEVQKFYQSSASLVQQAIKNYIERGFEELIVCYGCTGGQHRSVYMAETLAKELGSNPKVALELTHRDLETALQKAKL